MSETGNDGDGPSGESIHDTPRPTMPIEFFYTGRTLELTCTALRLAFRRAGEPDAPAFILSDVESGAELVFPAAYQERGKATEIILIVPSRDTYSLGTKTYDRDDFARILAAALTAWCDPPRDRGAPFVDDWPPSKRYVWDIRFEPSEPGEDGLDTDAAMPELKTFKETAATTLQKKRFRPLRWLGMVIAGFFGFSILSVCIHRFVPVPITILMVERAFQGHGIDHRWVGSQDISDNLKAAVIASEDSKFCSHHGFDVDAIKKAERYNATHRRTRGASTISQQTAKNVFLWPDRSWVRKGFEVWYTFLIEHLWPKERIMTVYLNSVEWAPGVYGAEAASQHYFHHSAKTLNSAEAAKLAAILPSPLKYKTTGHYVMRQSGRIQARARVVDNSGYDECAVE